MSQRTCAYDPNPAIAICTVCGEDICGLCHRPTLAGYAVCVTCSSKLERLLRTKWESARTPREYAYAFGHTAVAVLGTTRNFYASTPPVGPALKPLVFGTIAYLIGAFAAFLWQWVFADSFPSFLATFATETGIEKDAAFAVLLTAMPLAAPVIVAFHVALLHLSLRIFGAPTHWVLSARIVGYASAAYLFQLVPPVGEFPIGYMLSIVWLVNVEMVAVRRYFDLGIWRSMAAVFIPFILLMILGA